MKETERIREQLKRAFEGGAWHGPGVLEIIENVSAGQAASHPIAGAHSIWELVLHCAVQRCVHGFHALQNWFVQTGIVNGSNCVTELLMAFSQGGQGFFPCLVAGVGNGRPVFVIS